MGRAESEMSLSSVGPDPGGRKQGKSGENGSSSKGIICCGGDSRACCVTNPELKRGRRLQLLQMLALPFVPILALIAQNAFTLRDIVHNRHEVTEVDKQVSE
jgi:hypothetical protein